MEELVKEEEREILTTFFQTGERDRRIGPFFSRNSYYILQHPRPVLPCV